MTFRLKRSLTTIATAGAATAALAAGAALAQEGTDVLNGTETNQPEGDYRVEIRAHDGMVVPYRILALGDVTQLEECGIGLEDNVYDSNASGAVIGGSDCFMVRGTLLNVILEEPSEADVFVNGEKV
jgi:hypothetical protein